MIVFLWKIHHMMCFIIEGINQIILLVVDCYFIYYDEIFYEIIQNYK
jgi:hypothetical protein